MNVCFQKHLSETLLCHIKGYTKKKGGGDSEGQSVLCEDAVRMKRVVVV